MGRGTRGKTLAIKPVGAVVFAAALLLLLGLWAVPQAMTGGRAKELAERALAEGRLGLPEGGDLYGSVFTVQEPLQGSLPKGHHLVSATEKGLTSWFLLTEQPGGKGAFLYLGPSFGDEAAFSIADMGGSSVPSPSPTPATGTTSFPLSLSRWIPTAMGSVSSSPGRTPSSPPLSFPAA